MEFTDFLFYFFAVVLVLSSLRVVTAPDAVQSALFLVLAFFNAAAVWMLLHAEFLAILLVLVYVGAVMVLFLFVVMMLNIELDILRKDIRNFVPLASGMGLFIIFETALILWRGFSFATLVGRDETGTGQTTDIYSNTHAIGKLIYTQYIFAFEIAGLILLVAIIAAVALTLRHGKDRRQTDSAAQIRVRPEDRLKIIRMRSEPDNPV